MRLLLRTHSRLVLAILFAFWSSVAVAQSETKPSTSSPATPPAATTTTPSDNLVLSRVSAFIQPMLSTCASPCQPFVDAVNDCAPSSNANATSHRDLSSCLCQPASTIFAQRCATCLTTFDDSGTAYFRAALYDRYLSGCEALGELSVKSTSVSWHPPFSNNRVRTMMNGFLTYLQTIVVPSPTSTPPAWALLAASSAGSNDTSSSSSPLDLGLGPSAGQNDTTSNNGTTSGQGISATDAGRQCSVETSENGTVTGEPSSDAYISCSLARSAKGRRSF